jgi:hypothetical protein
MFDTVCPKCRTRSSSTACDSCGTVFAEYERDKQESIARVYQLISTGDLEHAREIAEKLPMEFPDSKGDFLLLLSNINRDINVVERYQQALESFGRGDFSEAVLLLRNIKAFDKGLDEKVISLRRKAERYGKHGQIFLEAVEKFEGGRFGEARALLKRIDGYIDQEKVDEYLQAIDDIKKDSLRAAVVCLQKNQFESAFGKLEMLRANFPEMRHETEEYLTIVSQKNEIRERLLFAARKAREEERYVEAKVIYSFLGWQYPESRASLAPYIEELGSRAVTSLADLAGDEAVDFAALGLQLDHDGFFISGFTATETAGSPHGGEGMRVASVAINPVPSGDPGSKPVDLDGDEVADFTY